MNREEAITTLKNYIERITGGMFPGEREILVEAFDALRGPQRDPETGLSPCGCGMPAVCIVNTEIMYDGKKRVKYSIKCPKNHVHTNLFDTQLQAKNYWQRAMGGSIG